VNFPNALTLSRIFIVPLLVVVLLTPVSENWLGVPRYLLAVVDFCRGRFDGLLRRKIGAQLETGLNPWASCLIRSRTSS